MDANTIEAIVQGLVGLATVFITAILAPLILKQVKVADGKLDQQGRDALYPILLNAISFAQAKVIADPDAAAKSVLNIQEHLTGLAANYARQHAGDTLDQLGVTDEALKRMLLARLQQAMSLAHEKIGGLSDQKAMLVGTPTAPAATN